MSNIEAKAKTTRQVIDGGLGTEDWDLEGFYKHDKPETKVDFEKPLWVPLEEAQKTANELEKWQVDWQNLNDEKMRIDSKIVEANKILEEIEGDPNLYQYWKTDFKHLRELLSNDNISTTQENKTQ